ncbi:UNVERIFIED_CONTAM: hypothetical protein FKN15_036312 [Acipenser sinensis]
MENETSTPTSATTTTSSTSSRTQAPQLSLYSSTTERQAVQVIQQAIHRPPSMAAQYLQQMYAAQQQHLMLQTAALQQQQHLSSLAAVQQLGSRYTIAFTQRKKQKLEMENETSTPTSATTTTSSTSSRTQAPQLSLYSSTTERQAVQVIQQAIHRPPSMAAQYLQQMYAAQQQHLMLQTAALQQQQHLSSLAAVQQINLSSSPAVQLISQSQTSSMAGSGGGGGALGQQSILLGNSSPTLTTSQAQMYLHAQMLILTPTATVAAVQPDIPVVSSTSSSHTPATQVQNLTLRPHQPSTLASPQSVPLKATSKGQPLAVAHPKMSVCPLKPSQQLEPLLEGDKKGEDPITEPKPTTPTCLPGAHQLIAPGTAATCETRTN